MFRARHAVFQQHAGDVLGRQPVADLRSFYVDGQILITASWEYHDCSAGVLSFRRIDRHCRLRDFADTHGWPAGYQEFLACCRGDLWPGDRLRIRRRSRPDRNLGVTGRWLPGGLLQGQSSRSKHKTNSEEQRLHHDLQGSI